MANEFKVAVVIPVFKHSVYVVEALNSVISQDGSDEICALIIDDGCPFSETQVICRSFAVAHRNVFYFRKANGGLSSARNFGIEFVIQSLPSVEAVYFLDADNRLTQTALRNSLAFLRNHPDADWVYPNADKFGVRWSGSYSGLYSPILHLLWDNLCDAGSLVRRDIIERDIRFDEQMKAGYEDWDFWLQCLQNGFKGKNYEEFGLEYRQRPVSMVALTILDRERIVHRIQEKHRTLLSLPALTQFEHEACPRFALVDPETTDVILFTDPRQVKKYLSLHEYCFCYWGNRIEPDSVQFPPFVGWMSSDDFDALKLAGVINSVLFEVERQCNQYRFVRVIIRKTDEYYTLSVVKNSGDWVEGSLGVRGWFACRATLDHKSSASADPEIGMSDLAGSRDGIVDVVIGLPRSFADTFQTGYAPAEAVSSTLRKLKEIGLRLDLRRWSWRAACIPNRSDTYLKVRSYFDLELAGNWLKSPEGVDVGILISTKVSWSAAEAIRMVAVILQQRGCRLHALCEGVRLRESDKPMSRSFHTIRFVDDFDLTSIADEYFCGNPVADKAAVAEKSRRLTGCLLDLDVIIHSQNVTINALSGVLRHNNVKLISYVDAPSHSVLGRQLGGPYSALAFEHVHDLFLTCSENLSDFLHGMGVPANKILRIPRFLSDVLRDVEDNSKFKFSAARPMTSQLSVILRVCCDRLREHDFIVDILRRSKFADMSVRWRILASTNAEISQDTWIDKLTRLNAEVYVDNKEPLERSRHYDHADIVVIPFFDERLALDVVKAQDSGCIPIVCGSPCAYEFVNHGCDGIVIDGDGWASRERIVAEVKALHDDLALRRRLADSAFRRTDQPDAWPVDDFLCHIVRRP